MFAKTWLEKTFFLTTVISLLFTVCLFSQVDNSQYSKYSSKKLSKNDGYHIDEVSTMFFDDDGWLWIAGNSWEAQNFKLNTRESIIQRFNGETFYDINIPENILDGASNFSIKKSLGSTIFLRVGNQKKPRLYRMDPRSLSFSEITLPRNSKNDIPRYEFFVLRDKVLLILKDPNGNQMFFLQKDDTFSYVGKMKTSKDIGNAYSVQFNDKILVSRFNFETELFSIQNDKLIQEEFNSSFSIDKNDVIESSFYSGNTAYFISNSDPNIHTFNQESGVIERSSVVKDPEVIRRQVLFQDQFHNVLLGQATDKESYFSSYSNIGGSPIYIFKPEKKGVNRSYFASRDLNKELVFSTDQHLEVLTFDKEVVESFLEKMSIRSMLQTNDNEVIISTDIGGWFSLDLESKRISHFKVTGDTFNITPQLNRDMYLDDQKIWSNHGRSILIVDIDSKNATRHRANNGITNMAQDESLVVFTDLVGSLNLFDKKTFQFKSLVKEDTLVYEKLMIENGIIYAGTNHGLKFIDNTKQEIFVPNEKDKYIVSLARYKQDKLLIGTRTGALYVFDKQSKSFELLFRDKLAASIATILLDSKDRIWLNTFAGIIAFDPKTKETKRFGTNDGLCHYEANRFSALKLDDGHFLVGTVKGVNLFHPDSLYSSISNDNLIHNLQWVSIEYFDQNEDTNKTLLDRATLDDIRSIKLPAKNRNLLLNFGIVKPAFDISYNYRYRLDDSEWIEIPNQHEIRLLNIESGSYNLEVQAMDKSKNTVLDSLLLELKVDQFFYESVWFYVLILILCLGALLVYSFKWREVNKANYKNRLLKTEIEYKKKDLADFATNISQNQQWNNHLLEKMKEIKESKGRKKGTAIVNLEKEIQEKNTVYENNYEFQKRIDLLSNEFYNSLLKQFPNLSKTEIKLCSLIRLDLDNYDIATLQNIDVSSVYKGRYRLRKKLNISSDTDLDAFLKAF